MVKIGVNGFGRVGRLLLRISLDQCGKENIGSNLPIISIMNDPDVSTECMGYLFKHDTFHGTFKKEVIDMDNCLLIEGHRIETVQEHDLSKVPWHKSCSIDYVVDTTGKNMTCATASKHLQEGIKNVLVSGCADIPVFVMGVNHTCYKPSMKTTSVATPSLNCLAAMLRVLNENFRVEKAMATVIHPLSNNDKILDDSKGLACREGRSVLINFMPVKTSAPGRYVSRIIPDLEGKVQSTAIKVPVPCVGAVDLTAVLGKEISYDRVMSKFKESADCYMKGIIKCSNEELVSSDVIGDPHSCILDVKAGVGLAKCTVKLFGWYDAEYALAHRLYDMIKYIASREVCAK